MSWNKKQLNAAKLYLILDTQVLSYQQLLIVLKDAVRSGIDIVQLRDKFGCVKDQLSFCQQALKITKHKALFIVNDRVDVAILSGADGVHLGQEDIPYLKARQLMGSKVLIGVSCQTKADALKAQAEGADYIGFGSVFKTKTKPERQPMDSKLLRQVWGQVKIPMFPIGGIDLTNIDRLTTAGINRAAICRDILLAPKPGQAVKDLKRVLCLRE